LHVRKTFFREAADGCICGINEAKRHSFKGEAKGREFTVFDESIRETNYKEDIL